jgi:hypothetical protein
MYWKQYGMVDPEPDKKYHKLMIEPNLDEPGGGNAW